MCRDPAGIDFEKHPHVHMISPYLEISMHSSPFWFTVSEI